ncbi:hypothetical protein BGW38_006974, partial [Lunasporangiospora selenospora]
MSAEYQRYFQKPSRLPLSPFSNGFNSMSEQGLFYVLFENNEDMDVHSDKFPETANMSIILTLDTPEGLSVRKRGKGGHAAAVNLWSLDTTWQHINELRDKNFKPCTYNKIGYLLRGSTKTDGFRLQVLAFK